MKDAYNYEKKDATNVSWVKNALNWWWYKYDYFFDKYKNLKSNGKEVEGLLEIVYSG